MNKINSRYILPLVGLLIFVLAAYTYYFLIKNIDPGVDIRIHNFILLEYLERGFFPIPPGYYFLIYLVDKLIHYKYDFVMSSILVLSFFTWWKYRILVQWFSEERALEKSILFGLGFIFIFPLVFPPAEQGFWYYGKFTSTLWHNSTSIAALPFSLLLFAKTIQWWKKGQVSGIWGLLGLGIAVLLIKPSFLFCFIPVFPVFTLLLKGWRLPFLRISIGLSLALLGLIWLEKYLIYNFDPIIVQDYSSQDRPEIVVQPFKVWLHYAFEPFWDFISSFMLSLVFLVFWGKQAFKKVDFSFSFVLLLVALLIYFLLSETGFREWHANFYWQIPITLLIHQVLMTKFVLGLPKNVNGKLELSRAVFWIILIAQITCGIVYWARIFVERTTV